MADTRIGNLAKLLVRYSLRLKKDQWVEIIGPYNAEPLLNACQVEALKAGAHVSMRVLLPESNYLFYKHAQDHQLRFVSPLEKLLNEKRDAMLFVWGGWNTKELSGIDPKRIAIAQAAQEALRPPAPARGEGVVPLGRHALSDRFFGAGRRDVAQ